MAALSVGGLSTAALRKNPGRHLLVKRLLYVTLAAVVPQRPQQHHLQFVYARKVEHHTEGSNLAEVHVPHGEVVIHLGFHDQAREENELLAVSAWDEGATRDHDEALDIDEGDDDTVDLHLGTEEDGLVEDGVYSAYLLQLKSTVG